MSFVGTGEEHKKAVQEALDYCVDEIDRLSAWEKSFVESISDQMQYRGKLSERQEEILEQIYCKLP
jgi:hypothetical protein